MLAVLALILASCTTSNTSQLAAGPASFGPLPPATLAETAPSSTDSAGVAVPSARPDQLAAAAVPAEPIQTAAAEEQVLKLPQSAAAPLAAPQPAVPLMASAERFAPKPAVPEQQAFQVASLAPAAAPQPAAAPAAVAAPAQGEAVLRAAPAEEAQLVSAPAFSPAPAKKKGLFASMFGGSPAEAAPKTVKTTSEAEALVRPKAQPAAVQVASLEEPSMRESLSGASLPGVRETALFDIKRRSGVDDDSDIDVSEEDAPVRVASAAGLARLAPNGLLVQTESVDTACLKPSLVRTLKAIERHYGKRIVVTSGYRSPTHNKKVRGARNSLHMYCAAADIQIAGVGKWELARFARTMSGRGGVGTYCHTESVHIDVGPERDWNWRCRRSKRG